MSTAYAIESVDILHKIADRFVQFCANHKRFPKGNCTACSELCSLFAESKSCAHEAHDITDNIPHRGNIRKASDGLATDCWTTCHGLCTEQVR